MMHMSRIKLLSCFGLYFEEDWEFTAEDLQILQLFSAVIVVLVTEAKMIQIEDSAGMVDGRVKYHAFGSLVCLMFA